MLTCPPFFYPPPSSRLCYRAALSLMVCLPRFDRPIDPSLASPALSRPRRSLHRYFSSTRLSTLLQVRLFLASSACGNVVLHSLDLHQPAFPSPSFTITSTSLGPSRLARPITPPPNSVCSVQPSCFLGQHCLISHLQAKALTSRPAPLSLSSPSRLSPPFPLLSAEDESYSPVHLLDPGFFSFPLNNFLVSLPGHIGSCEGSPRKHQ